LPDPKIILSGFLLGTSPSGALSLKDRAQGNPLWLEHAILDKARDPRALKQPNSSLSLVMNALLSGVGEVEKKAFWDSRPEGRYLPKAYEHDGLSR
jgi:hypothetical protein